MSVNDLRDPTSPKSGRLFGHPPPLTSACSALQLVPLADIQPHEDHSSQRAGRLADAIALDGKQRHPVILGRSTRAPLLHLDGINRIAALRSLGCAHVAAQIVDYHDERAVALDTWSHITRLDASGLLANGSTVWNVRPFTRTEANFALARSALIAVVVFATGDTLGVTCPGSIFDKMECLAWLSNSYRVEPVRVATCGFVEVSQADRLLKDYPQANALVLFGGVAKQQIIDVALGGRKLVPPGITRHIINCGRVLNVDVPLSLLRSKELIAKKAITISKVLGRKTPRVYHEPTIHLED